MKGLSPYSLHLEEESKSSYSYNYILEETFFQTIANPQYPGGKVRVKIDVTKKGEVFELKFSYYGTIKLVCDRCLDMFDFPIQTEGTLNARLGEEYKEIEDDWVIVDRRSGDLDVAWRMFEDIVLSIPIRHTHPEGECNPEMEKILAEHSSQDKPDSCVQNEEKEMDPRWEKLKELLNH